MAQKRIEQLFKDLGKKYNLPPYVIEEVYNSQFKKLKEEIGTYEFPTIKLPNWGKYIPSQLKLKDKDFTDKQNEMKERKKLKELKKKNG